MTITKANLKSINLNDIYIHDDILISLKFERDIKKLILAFKKYSKEEMHYTMVFCNVGGFEMTSCDFWGASECVLDFENIEEDKQVLIPKLLKKWAETPNPFANVSYNDYMETLLIFSSGDTLRVACQKIEIM